MARAGHVGVDTTVSTVSTSSGLGGLVHLNVGNNEGVHVERLGGSVGFNVLEEIENETARLDGPATLSDAENLGF